MAYVPITNNFLRRVQLKERARRIELHVKNLITQRDQNVVTLADDAAIRAYRVAYYQNLIDLGIGDAGAHATAQANDALMLSEGTTALNSEQTRLATRITARFNAFTTVRDLAVSNLNINQVELDDYNSTATELTRLIG
jgi:hypothetical protein